MHQFHLVLRLVGLPEFDKHCHRKAENSREIRLRREELVEPIFKDDLHNEDQEVGVQLFNRSFFFCEVFRNSLRLDSLEFFHSLKTGLNYVILQESKHKSSQLGLFRFQTESDDPVNQALNSLDFTLLTCLILGEPGLVETAFEVAGELLARLFRADDGLHENFQVAVVHNLEQGVLVVGVQQCGNNAQVVTR